MNASRAALMVVGVNLMAVWAAAAAGGRTAAPQSLAPPPHAAVDRAVDEASASLLVAAGRLEAHARREIPATVTRNPFRFAADARPAPVRAPAEPAAGAPAPAEPPADAGPDVVLQGMAESAEGDTVVRTAILRAGGDLVFATMGTRVAGRYDVVALTSDSVEVQDLADGVRRTWRMK
jgi:hypothetical protein